MKIDSIFPTKIYFKIPVVNEEVLLPLYSHKRFLMLRRNKL